MLSKGDHKEDLQNKKIDEFEEDNALEDGDVSQEKSNKNSFKLYLELV